MSLLNGTASKLRVGWNDDHTITGSLGRKAVLDYGSQENFVVRHQLKLWSDDSALTIKFWVDVSSTDAKS